MNSFPFIYSSSESSSLPTFTDPFGHVSDEQKLMAELELSFPPFTPPVTAAALVEEKGPLSSDLSHYQLY